MSSPGATADMEVIPNDVQCDGVDCGSGRMVVKVRGTSFDDSSPEACAGWTVATRRSRPKEREPVPPLQHGKPTGKRINAPQLTRAQFAEKINKSVARTARMPRMPANYNKVVIRPRGGLVIKEVEPLEFNKAMATAANVGLNVFKTDTTYPNIGQNILVISTPSQERAVAYANVREINLRGRKYEIFAYRAAPENTVKGMIYNISQAYSQADINECIVNESNPTAIAAQRVGETRSVIVLFEGNRVPNHINFAGFMTRCKLYKQHREVCRTCGQVGHRRDVCPRPEAKVCFACGTANPEADHDSTCKPRCKLCGGPHVTGTGNCPNKYKTPYVVRLREREKKMAQKKALLKGKVTFPDRGDFPKLNESQPQQEKERRHKSRSISRSKSRGKSNERGRSQSGTRRTWVDVAAIKNRDASTDRRAAAAAMPSGKGNSLSPLPPARDSSSAEVTELRSMVAQLQDTVREQKKMIEQLIASARQQSNSNNEATSTNTWQLGKIPQPACFTPLGAKPTTTSQPPAKIRKRATASKTEGKEMDESEMCEGDSNNANTEETRQSEDDGINYGVRIHKQGKRLDKLANQVRTLSEKMNSIEHGFIEMRREFTDLKQLIIDQLSPNEGSQHPQQHRLEGTPKYGSST